MQHMQQLQQHCSTAATATQQQQRQYVLNLVAIKLLRFASNKTRQLSKQLIRESNIELSLINII